MKCEVVINWGVSIMCACFGLFFMVKDQTLLSTHSFSVATYLICLAVFNHVTDKEKKRLR